MTTTDDSCVTCPQCGRAFGRSGRGRPKVFCTESCRLAAGYALRRVQTQLMVLEEQLAHARAASAGPWADMRDIFGLDAAQRIAHLETEIQRGEARMCQLLGGTE